MKMLMLALSIAVLSFGLIGLAAQTVGPAAPAVSRVHELEIEDQSENPGNISADEAYRHGDARRAEVRMLLAQGKLITGEDFSDAALIFQHGRTSEDFLFAQVLAVEGLSRGGSADKWIAASTLDRYLQSINQPQVFGTQYTGDKSAGNTPKQQVDPHVINIQRTQQPYDSKLLPDAVRQDFCVPDVKPAGKESRYFQYRASSRGQADAGDCMRAVALAGNQGQRSVVFQVIKNGGNDGTSRTRGLCRARCVLNVTN